VTRNGGVPPVAVPPAPSAAYLTRSRAHAERSAAEAAEEEADALALREQAAAADSEQREWLVLSVLAERALNKSNKLCKHQACAGCVNAALLRPNTCTPPHTLHRPFLLAAKASSSTC